VDNKVEEAFEAFEKEILAKRVKELEFDNAELSVKNEELMERVKKLANRQPSWPKGYRPQRRFQKNK
jgi:hypothetical protein|tara:strand:+ start:1327 stop:1527 length:201 start_codon:yes stop_codon:yes gene_type:complete